MQTKLYVTNLSRLATLSTVRQFFAACGDVADVEFLAERSSRPPSAAYVTMATAAGAAVAVGKLHGVLLHDRSLMVSLAVGGPRGDERPARKPAPVPEKAIVSQQYRDRHGMVYELDCTGVRLTLRFFFPEGAEERWRLQVRTSSGSETTIEATAATRELAFDAVIQAWPRPVSGLPEAGASCEELPWADVARALKAVRAI